MTTHIAPSQEHDFRNPDDIEDVHERLRRRLRLYDKAIADGKATYADKTLRDLIEAVLLLKVRNP